MRGKQATVASPFVRRNELQKGPWLGHLKRTEGGGDGGTVRLKTGNSSKKKKDREPLKKKKSDRWSLEWRLEKKNQSIHPRKQGCGEMVMKERDLQIKGKERRLHRWS